MGKSAKEAESCVSREGRIPVTYQSAVLNEYCHRSGSTTELSTTEQCNLKGRSTTLQLPGMSKHRQTDRRFRQHLLVYFASYHYTYSHFFLFLNFRLNVFFHFPLNYFFIPTFSSLYIYSQFLFLSFVYLFSLLFVCLPFSISFSFNF